MSRRIPLWATLIPLVLGVLLWAWLWRGYEARLESDLAKILPPGTAIEATGFPYRLEARIAPARAESQLKSASIVSRRGTGPSVTSSS